jgi:hypothetical protein
MYVGNMKVGGSIHERVNLISFEIFDIWLWLVGCGPNILPDGWKRLMTNDLMFNV